MDSILILEINPKSDQTLKSFQSILKELERAFSMNEPKLYQMYLTHLPPLLARISLAMVIYFKVTILELTKTNISVTSSNNV